VERGKPENPEKNPLSEARTNSWWEASALTSGGSRHRGGGGGPGPLPPLILGNKKKGRKKTAEKPAGQAKKRLPPLHPIPLTSRSGSATGHHCAIPAP